MVILLLTLLVMMGFGIMDELAHHYKSIKIPFIKNNPQFWDKSISWKNKWIIEYNKSLLIVTSKEKFWGSSRWFVFLTDGWHLVQFISYQLLALAIAFALADQIWVALLLSLPLHIGMSTIKAVTMKVV